jgi:ankyrin repeat protein
MSELHFAAYNGWDEDVSRLLADEHDPNALDKSGYSPLHWACFRAGVTDQSKVIQLLIDANANIEALTADGMSTPLILAIEAGDPKAVDVLLAAGVDVEFAAQDVTPLMVAARNGDETLVGALVGAGASPNRLSGGFCAADYAAYGGHFELSTQLRSSST